MWPILFLLLQAPAPAAPPAPPSTLDFGIYKAKVQPLFFEKRPGHARCITCHARSSAFRLQPLPAGRAWNEEESRKNFEMASRFVLPGAPARSRLLTMPLEHEAGGTEFHSGGKHWKSQDDSRWNALADWVHSSK
jgi:hypothetical protein